MPILPSDVRYAPAGDLSIAWREVGSGPVAAVFVLPLYSNVEGIAGGPLGAFLEHLAAVVRVVMLDLRGMGVSDSPTSGIDTDAYVEDVLAVLDAAGVGQAHVVTIGAGCAIALRLATVRPERVSSLVLLSPSASGKAASHARIFTAMSRAAEAWGSGDSLLLFQPELSERPGARERAGRIERAGAAPRDVRNAIKWMGALDYEDDARVTEAPTSILVQRDSAELAAPGVELAGLVEGARLIEVPGASVMPWDDGALELAALVEECLFGTRTASSVSRALRTLLVTDIVGSTELAADLGDERWRALRDRHDTLVRDLLRAFAGREIKHTGDGFLVVLPTPSDAVRCAQTIQQQLIPHELHVRAGVHLGECEALGDDLGGMAVHIAARAAALASPDEVLVTTAVRDAMLGSAISFTTRGEYDLKGVPGTWQLHAATKHPAPA